MSDDDLARAADDALARQIVGRREEALAEAYRRHAGAVHNFARRLVGDPRLAEEVLQDIFLDLWRRPDRYDPERGSLAAYLLSRTHGRSVDLLRAETARRRREERDARERLELTSGPDTAVVEIITAAEVRRLLGELTPAVREAIRLAFFDGHTYQQVAAVLGQPEGTVKGWIRSGLRRLRAGLTEPRTPPAAG